MERKVWNIKYGKRKIKIPPKAEQKRGQKSGINNAKNPQNAERKKNC